MTISRRQFVSSGAGADVAALGSPDLVLAQGSEPVRIGLLAAKTGPHASEFLKNPVYSRDYPPGKNLEL